MIKIVSTDSQDVIFECEARTIKEAVETAIRNGRRLTYAFLGKADLAGADLREANLIQAYLIGANLCGADLTLANLSGARLFKANLSIANLSGADLNGAELYEANLIGADLYRVNFQGANLRNARFDPLPIARLTIVPTEGAFIGWKKCQNNVIVKLRIMENARRSNGTGRKCRAEAVEVLEVIGAEKGISCYDSGFVYRKGEIVSCIRWDENRWIECGGGIHFFLTREEAESYDY